MALSGAFFSVYLWHALQRLSAMHNHTFDLALYARAAWGFAGGRAYVSLLDLNFLSAHASFALIPLGLLGRLTDTPTVLLSAQAAALAAAAWPLSRIGARRFGPPGALAAAALWLLYPNAGHVASYEMHPGSLAIFPLCAALDALDRGDGRRLWQWSLAVVACRADYALVTLALGVLYAWRSDGVDGAAAWRAWPPRGWLARAWPPRGRLARAWPPRDAGVRLALASALYFGLFALLLPALSGSGGRSAAVHFAAWGGSPLGALPALFQDPQRVLSHFAAPGRLRYPLRVLWPLSLLPLLRPRLLLPAMPPLLLNLLSTFPTTTELYSHYLTPAVPALVYAGLDAAHRLGPRLRVPALGAALTAAAAGSALCGGLPWSRDYPAADFAADGRTAARRAALAAIPVDASVQAPDPLLPHLAERATVHRAPPPERGTDYVVLDISHRRRFAGQESLLRTVEEPVTRAWLAREDHALVAAPADLLVLARGGDPRAGLVRRYFTRGSTGGLPKRLCGCLSLQAARLLDKGLRLDLRAAAACPADLAIRFGAAQRPTRVDLLFDGLLSPAQLRAGDHLRSLHPLSRAERAAIETRGLHIGALRSSGAPPEKRDRVAIPFPITRD